MKNKLFITVFVFLSLVFPALAKAADVNLTIRDDNTIIFSNTIPLQPAGSINLNDSNGIPHSLEADSVLSVLNDADILSSDFNISNLEYYDSFSSFYLKCITDSFGNKCDNWQYTVDDSYPSNGMDKTILSGGENIYLYFGPQHKIIIDTASITTDDNLKVTTQDYDYKNNDWKIRTGIIVGLTQPDPDNPWSPKEILTGEVNNEGQAIFSNIPEGTYNVGVKEDFYFPTESLTVTAQIKHHSSGSSYVSIPPPEPKLIFNSQKAFDFLISQQKENGSFGEELYTDWATISLASNLENQKENLGKISKYFSENKFSGTSLTDYERHAMALMSLGINPYDVGGENYIEKIISKFDGAQFGDPNQDNDDIFALIVLQNVGYKQNEKMIIDTINYLLSKQKENGSWDESIDLTGAGIEALSFSSDQKVSEKLKRAKEYLKQNQKNDGGFGNISSTAWAMEGILALREKPEDWKINKNSPLDYLAENQENDGGIKGVEINSRIWETSYVLTSLSGKTWNQIMQKFEKPAIKIETISPTTNQSVNPLQETLENSYPKKFEKELKKFQKPAIKKIEIEKSNLIDTKNVEPKIEPVKKENWFRKLWRKIFGN